MILEVKHLSFNYGKKNILKDVSFSINRGEIVSLLGKNGAGKSTLINLLLGIKKPNVGDVYLDDKLINKYKPNERAKKIAYVPQELEETSLSVYDFLLLGKLPYFNLLPSPNDKEEITKVLFMFGLANIAYRSMSEISGGERQLVNILRALLTHPDVLLLDEPTSSLDIKNQKKILLLLKDIARKENIVVMLSLHDINEALFISDRLLLLKDGKLKYDIKSNEINDKIINDIYDVKANIVNVNNSKIISFLEKEKTDE